MTLGYSYHNSYGYQSPTYAQGPTWAEYLSTYNQKAASNRQAYQSSTGNTGAGRVYNQFDAGGGQGSAGFAAGVKYLGGDKQPVNNFGQGMNSVEHGSDFQSDPNNSYAKQTYQDWLGDQKSGVALLPGANNWRAVQSYQSHKRAQRAQAEWQHNQEVQKTFAQHQGISDWARSLDPRIAAEMQANMEKTHSYDLDPKEADVWNRYQQLKQQDTEGQLSNNVNQYFADPSREMKLEQNLGAQRTNQLGQLADQYNQTRIKQAQISADRGTLGSSMDITQRGQLGRARDSAAVGVENDLQGQRANFQTNDNQAKQQLMSMIYSHDPAQAQYAQSVLSGLDQGTQDEMNYLGSQNQMGDINSYLSSLQSQTIGGGLNAGASGINAYGPYLAQYYQNRGA